MKKTFKALVTYSDTLWIEIDYEGDYVTEDELREMVTAQFEMDHEGATVEDIDLDLYPEVQAVQSETD